MATGTFNESTAALTAWHDHEIGMYNFSNPGFLSGTGHMTQVKP